MRLEAAQIPSFYIRGMWSLAFTTLKEFAVACGSKLVSIHTRDGVITRQSFDVRSWKSKLFLSSQTALGL
jgi:hypothetical protein